MRFIKTHKSWNQGEIVEFLKTSGGFTCCTLPHYRYQPVKDIMHALFKHKLVRIVGRTEITRHYRRSPLFDEWMAAVQSGETTLGPIKWAKQRKLELEQIQRDIKELTE